MPNCKQLEKIVKKKLNRCDGYMRKKEQTDRNCQQQIRVSSKINVISDTLIKKSSNKIKIVIDQITEIIKIDKTESKEQELKGLILIEEL